MNKIIGIIAEYNPFHLGHIYQINEIKKLYPKSTIIAIISPSFTQRGDISIINKYNKTTICLENNIDLVVELPYPYATQSSDIFAKGSIEILNKLNINTLVFGSESNDLETLKKLANISNNDTNYHLKVKEYLNKGYNYPTAMSKALFDITNINISTPNDLLALSYLKVINKYNYPIDPISIKRTNDYHATYLDNSKIVNATLIRKLYNDNQDISSYIANNSLNKLIKIDYSNLYSLLKLQIINNINNLSTYQTVEEGIENRIKKYIYKSNTWEELVNNIKTKRYTYNRINRMLIHILNSYKKSDNDNINIDYIRILGFNNKGRKHLNNIKKKLDIKLISNYKPNISKLLDIEFKITCNYARANTQSVSEKANIDNELINKEFNSYPIRK